MQSIDPNGTIKLKDYLTCKGMEEGAYFLTRKENSLYLQTPNRTYQFKANDWQTSEDWVDSIANIGEFQAKKADTRNPSIHQASILSNTDSIINHASSLIHWFKLIVHSTPSSHSSALYDLPSELGMTIIHLTRGALHVMEQPTNNLYCATLKEEVAKVAVQVQKMAQFITSYDETHKAKFNADLEIITKAIKVLQSEVVH